MLWKHEQTKQTFIKQSKNHTHDFMNKIGSYEFVKILQCTFPDTNKVQT